jgi:hypothetical protein
MNAEHMNELEQCLIRNRRLFMVRNYVNAKNLLLSTKSERQFSVAGNNFNVRRKDFIKGHPSNHIVGMKCRSMWDQYDLACKLAYC